MTSKAFFLFVLTVFSLSSASRNALALSLPASAPSQACSSPIFTAEDVEKVILTLLDKKPQIVLTALKKAMEQEEKDQLHTQERLVQKHRALLFKQDASLPTSGNPKGDIQIVAFFDYQCGYCKKSEEALSDLLKKDPNVHVIYREMPIFGKKSIYFSELALAAHLQGKYDCLHKSLMNHGRELTESNALKCAKKCGLDLSKLKKDMASDTILKALSENKKLAEALAIDAAPFFVINDHIIPGLLSKEILQRLISRQRATSKPSFSAPSSK